MTKLVISAVVSVLALAACNEPAIPKNQAALKSFAAQTAPKVGGHLAMVATLDARGTHNHP